MGRIQINGFEIDFDEDDYNPETWDKDVDIVYSEISNWYEDNQDKLSMTMESCDGGYNFTLLNWRDGREYGSMDKWMREEFTLAELKEEIFNTWLDENKHDAIVIREKKRKTKK